MKQGCGCEGSPALPLFAAAMSIWLRSFRRRSRSHAAARALRQSQSIPRSRGYRPGHRALVAVRLVSARRRRGIRVDSQHARPSCSRGGKTHRQGSLRSALRRARAARLAPARRRDFAALLQLAPRHDADVIVALPQRSRSFASAKAGRRRGTGHPVGFAQVRTSQCDIPFEYRNVSPGRPALGGP